VPATRHSTIGNRAFIVAGPRAWNNLPVDLRLSGTFTIFKTHLKSHLFNSSFPSVWLYYWLHHWLFLYRALEAACAAYASLNLSLLHYITLHVAWCVMCRHNRITCIMELIVISCGSWHPVSRQPVVACDNSPASEKISSQLYVISITDTTETSAAILKDWIVCSVSGITKRLSLLQTSY